MTCALASASAQQPGGSEYAPVDPAATTSVQDIARIAGRGGTPLSGIGLVVGLAGTGDDGGDLLLAEPMLQVYRNNGMYVEDTAMLAKAQSAAIVWVQCEVPDEGAVADDRFDVVVSVMHSASSIDGGQLLLSPLTGPLTQQGVFAVARGSIVTEDLGQPTVGRIYRGAQVVQPIEMPDIVDHFNLVIEPAFRSWATTQRLAGQIDGLVSWADPDSPPIARAANESVIQVAIPPNERHDPSAFITRVMSHRFGLNILDLPAGIVVNKRTGVIVVSDDVVISPVAITHKDLAITITDPPPAATPADPLVTQEHWIDLANSGRANKRARARDLVGMFKRLDLALDDQIAILRELHAGGHVTGRLIIR